MKNILRLVLLLGVTFTVLGIGKSNVGYAEKLPLTPQNLITEDIEVSITDSKTNKTTILNGENIVSNIQVEEDTSSDTESKIVGYDIFIPIATNTGINTGISTLASGSGSKTTGGVKASINVNYDLKSAGEQIRVNKFSGSWAPTSTMYTVSNRDVGVHSGLVWGNKLNKKPTSNSFSYTTGWGYNVFALEDGSPRAWSDAVVTISGMTAKQEISVEITFP